jgi:hypothetical protein
VARVRRGGPAQTVVISQNQQGGITAGTVNLGAQEPRVAGPYVARNEPVPSGGYLTQVELMVESDYPLGEVAIQAHAPSIRQIQLVRDGGGMMMYGPEGVRDGMAFTSLLNAYGKLILSILTDKPEDVRIEGGWR